MTEEAGAEESGTRARAARAPKIALALTKPQQAELPPAPEQRIAKAQGLRTVRWAREPTRALTLPEPMRKRKPKASQEQVKERKQA
jgi:hypothetical protein